MADDFSRPRAISDPAADITDVYAFPSPQRPGHLVLVLNVFPAATPTALFSDAIDYRFRVRPVTPTVAPTGAGAAPAFEVGADEYAFTVSFTAPRVNGGDAAGQAGTCSAPRGRRISFRVGDDRVPEASGLRAFAGPRLDLGQNVLSVVLEIDAPAVLGPGNGPLLAVVGETVTHGSHPVRVERMGRPRIRNFILTPGKPDAVNGDLEISELYSAEDAFSLRPDYAATYRSRLDASLAYFDRLDGKVDWARDEQGSHPLTTLLLADFLVVDVSKPLSDDSCLEIETAMLAGRAHETCGGRSPNDTAARAFPYLASPGPNPPGLMSAEPTP